MSFTSLFGGQTIYPSQLLYLPLAMTADIELTWPLETVPGPNVVADIIEIQSATGALTITMPDARKGSNGVSVLINNRSAQTITLEDALGNTIGAVPSGEVWQFYLASNATEAGTWRTFQFGTGTSSATAASLAGAGLKAISTTLNLQYTPRSDSVSPLDIIDSDRAKVVQWTGGVGAGTLPDPATLGADWFTMVRNNGGGTWTITPATGTINDGSSLSLAPFSSAIIYCTGTAYYTIGLSSVTPTNFDYTSINIAGGAGDYTLSGPELNRITYELTGVISGNRNVIVPNAVQQYWVNNQTTGAFSVTVKTDAGSGIEIPQGASVLVYSDGTNVVAAEGVSGSGLIPLGLGGLGTALTAPGADRLYFYDQSALASAFLTPGLNTYIDTTTLNTGPIVRACGGDSFSNNTLTVVTGGSNIPLEVGTYRVKFFLKFRIANAVSGVDARWSLVSGTATLDGTVSPGVQHGGTYNSDPQTNGVRNLWPNNAQIVTLPATNQWTTLVFDGILLVSVAGTVSFQAAQNATDGANPMTMDSFCYLTFERLRYV